MFLKFQIQRFYTFLSIIDLILRRGQRGPIARLRKSIIAYSDRHFFEGDSDIDHFLSFAELYRAVRKGYQFRKPVIATLHHLDKKRRHRHFSDIFAACQYICVVSSQWKDHLMSVERVPEEKIKVIYNAANGYLCGENIFPMKLLSKDEKLLLRDEFGIPRNAFVVGHLGREKEWRKDCQTYYSVLDKIDVYPVFLEQSSRGIANLVSYDRYRDLYNIMDVYVNSSVVEGGPLGYIEAIACGTPVVSTKVGMALDFHPDQFLCDIRSVDQMLERMIFVRNNYDFVLQETLKLRDKLSWLTWSWVAVQYDELYSLCGNFYI